MSQTSIVLQLQELAVDPESNCEELLHKALLVATKLKIDKLKQWCKLELEGYYGKEVPSYRKIKGELKAINPLRGSIPFFLPPEFEELVTNVPIIQSIGDICTLVNSGKDSFVFVLTPEMKECLMEMQDTYYKMEPKLVLHSIQLKGILKKVKNIILNWSL